MRNFNFVILINGNFSCGFKGFIKTFSKWVHTEIWQKKISIWIFSAILFFWNLSSRLFCPKPQKGRFFLSGHRSKWNRFENGQNRRFCHVVFGRHFENTFFCRLILLDRCESFLKWVTLLNQFYLTNWRNYLIYFQKM